MLCFMRKKKLHDTIYGGTFISMIVPPNVYKHDNIHHWIGMLDTRDKLPYKHDPTIELQENEYLGNKEYVITYGAIMVVKLSKLKYMEKHLAHGKYMKKEDIYKEIRIHKILAKQPDVTKYIFPIIHCQKTKLELQLIFELGEIDLCDTLIGLDNITYARDKMMLPSRFSFHCIKQYFQHMCRCVKFVHDQGIAHMDISLENFVLCKTSKLPKIIDFGLARTLSKDTTHHFNTNEHEDIYDKCRIGKRDYISVQNYQGLAYNGYKQDIYSLGICLLLLVVGDIDKNFLPCMLDNDYTPLEYARRCSWLYENHNEAKQIHQILHHTLAIEENKRSSIEEVLDMEFCI